MDKNIENLPLKRIDGSETTLSAFKGKVLLLVNVASKCGLTPQYEGLEKLHEQYQGQGLVVMGFPANEFGAQEPGSDAEIQEFCRSNFGVAFPMFSKIVVKGPGQHPLYHYLTHTRPDAWFPEHSQFRARMEKYGMKRESMHEVHWNFEKFLVSREGEVVGRFSPDTTPEDPAFKQALEAELAKA
ncbi:glutathione peroxidase [Melittangium boletus]|uniref:glutathione peroxidase n=1 Tax=Melittangium boletus TaxID=83453 RepID=UPI003DA5531F